MVASKEYADLDDERLWFAEHIEADHEVLKRIFNLHRRSRVIRFHDEAICLECGGSWPCKTIRAFDA